MIDEIISPLTDPPDVPVVADGQETFNARASAWLVYWKNNIYVEIESLIYKLNTFRNQVNVEIGIIEDIKIDVTQLKEDTSTIKNDTNTIRNETLVLKNETLAYIDATFGSSNIWTEINLTATSHTASTLEMIRVDPTLIGGDVVITLPSNPNNRDMIEIMNVDLTKTNTLIIVRGDATHLINAELEDAEFNCTCIVKLVFDSVTKNWIKG